MLRGLVSTWAMVASTLAFAADGPSAADAIAQKFAGQQQAQTTPPQMAKSATMPAQRPPLDYEMDMLRRARAEHAAPTIPTPKVVAKTTDAPVPAKTSVPVAQPTAAPAATLTAPPKFADVPATAVAPKVEAPAAPQVSQATSETRAPAPAATATPVIQTANLPTVQASVLLAIETSGVSTKAGAAKNFDPMICMADTCFISAGLDADAVKLTKSDALKLKSTTDASPDSCKAKVGCVFRNVAVTKNAQIQVVELGSASHDPSRTFDAQPDTTCKMSDGNLACDNPIATADFRLWVVPEATAKTAGVQAIEEAVADSLPHEEKPRDTDK